MLDCNPIQLPLNASNPFGRPTNKHNVIVNLPSRYQKLIGELLYLAVCTCPDISYPVNTFVQHNASPSSAHYATAKRLLRHLTGSINLHLEYDHKLADATLHGYCDADWASSPDDHRSISGYTWFYAGGLIAHVSKKQVTVALSSMEAEYMVVTHVIQEGLWLKSLLVQLHVPFNLPIIIHMDNTGAISLSKEARNHIRSKHIDVHYHFIRIHIEKNTFLPKWLPSHMNMADILTICSETRQIRA